MNRTVFFFAVIFLVLTSSVCKSATIIGGLITSNTTLSLSGSPYYLVSDLTINSTSTLTIDSGVQILAKGNFGIWVWGSLTINGTAKSPVNIEGEPLGVGANVFWRGIVVLQDTARVKLQNAQIRNAATAVDYSRIVVKTSQPYIEVQIDGCVFENNISAIRTTVNGNKGYVRYCTFKNNKLGIDGSGIYADSAHYKFVANLLSVHNCTFEKNGTALIYLKSTSNCLFVDNNAAIKFIAFGVVNTCVFKNNRLGMRGHSLTMYLNDFINNDTGIVVHGDTADLPASTDEIVINYGLFVENKIAVLAEINSKDYHVQCGEFIKNKIAVKSQAISFSLSSPASSPRNITGSLFDKNDTAIFIEGVPTEVPPLPVYDSVYFEIGSSYFNGGNYYVYNTTNVDINLFKSIFVDSVKPIEDYLFDKSDNPATGAFNYDVSIVTPVYDSTIRNDYYYKYTTDTIILKHTRYKPTDVMKISSQIGGCRKKSQALTLKTPEIKQAIKPIIYPNPATTELNIVIENGQIKNVVIYSISGKKVLEQTTADMPANFITLDISGFETGLYFIELETNNGLSRAKFIKR